AVVGDVAVGQQPVVVAHAGDAAAVAGAAVDGDELAEHVAVADHQLGALAGELLVLRLAADGAVADEAVAAADPGRAGEAAVRADLAAVADLDLRADHGEGADAHALAQAGGGIDDRGGVDLGLVVHCLVHSRVPAHSTSAQATTSPSTLASPEYTAMLRITRLTETCSPRTSPGATCLLKRAVSTLT